MRLIAALLLLAGCSGPLGTIESPHGYSAVGQWQSTGIFVGNPQTGNGLNLGSTSWAGAIWPTLDGEGQPFGSTDVRVCYGTEAGTGAEIVTAIVIGDAATGGCP